MFLAALAALYLALFLPLRQTNICIFLHQKRINEFQKLAFLLETNENYWKLLKDK